MNTPESEQQVDGELTAFIICWNANTLTVLCPYCGQIEVHTPSWSQTSIRALCKRPNIYYKVDFHARALKQGTIAYEINREKKRLDIIGIKILEPRNQLTATSDEHNLLDEGQLDRNFAPAARAREQIPAARIGAVHLFLDLQKPQSGDSEEDNPIARGAMGYNYAWESQHKRRASTYLNAVRVAEERLGAVVKTSFHGAHFSPTIVLGDLTRLQSRRSTEGRIEIFAPLGTKDGVRFPAAFATIKGQLLKQRTVGVLDRKGLYPPVIAVSGSSNWMVGSEYILDNVKWTLEVQRLACYLIHILKTNALDNDRPEGDTDACHVEKKLIAFFIQKHLFYEDGYEEDLEVINLKKVLPGQGLREVWIAVDNAPCCQCITFKKKVEACFHVKIHFVEMDHDFRRHTPTKITSSLLLTPPASRTQQVSIQIPVRRLEEEDDEELDGIDEFGDPTSPSYQRNGVSSAQNAPPSPSEEHSNTSTNMTFTTHRKRALTFSVDIAEQIVSSITNKTESLNLSKRPKFKRFTRRIILDSDDEDEDPSPVEHTKEDRVQTAAGKDDGPPFNIADEHEIIMISSDDEGPNDEPSLLGSEDLDEVLRDIQNHGTMTTDDDAELAMDISLIDADDADRHNSLPLHNRNQSGSAGKRARDESRRRSVVASGTGIPRSESIDLPSEDSRGVMRRPQRRVHCFFGPADPFDDEHDEDYCGEGVGDGGESSSGSESGCGNWRGNASWSGSESGSDSHSGSDSQSQRDSSSEELDDDSDDDDDDDEDEDEDEDEV